MFWENRNAVWATGAGVVLAAASLYVMLGSGARR
jgi:hypothetical protein